MIAIPLRASIRKARFSFSVRIEDIETSRRLLLGVAGNLVSSSAEAVDTVAVEIAFPGEKFIDRVVVEGASLIDRHPPAADRFDNARLAMHGPSLPGPR